MRWTSVIQEPILFRASDNLLWGLRLVTQVKQANKSKLNGDSWVTCGKNVFLRGTKLITVASCKRWSEKASCLSAARTGGAQTTFPETILWFEETEVTRLLSRFLGVFSQTFKIVFAWLHSWTMFQQVWTHLEEHEYIDMCALVCAEIFLFLTAEKL